MSLFWSSCRRIWTCYQEPPPYCRRPVCSFDCPPPPPLPLALLLRVPVTGLSVPVIQADRRVAAGLAWGLFFFCLLTRHLRQLWGPQTVWVRRIMSKSLLFMRLLSSSGEMDSVKAGKGGMFRRTMLPLLDKRVRACKRLPACQRCS